MKAYVPVALILCTEIENHDIFRYMLKEIFEAIRKPDSIFDKKSVLKPEQNKHKDFAHIRLNKHFAFADMLAHLAFLKTLPCPSFNTQLNITLYKKNFLINELEYKKIPQRNSIAIQTLF